MEKEPKYLNNKKNPSFTGQLFLDVKHKIDMKLGRDIQIPWMKHKEMDILIEVLKNKKPHKCLEWGSGFSTLLFSNYLPKEGQWTSIEHNEDWFKKIASKITADNVKINLVKADHVPFTDKYNDGSYEDFQTYINKPQGKFDFIFIDGRSRKNCMEKAHSLLEPEGVVILHDANREYYHDPFTLFKYQALFVDHNDRWGGIWIGSKDLPIDTILNIKKHQKLWKKHLAFNKVIGHFRNN